jgi:hypothetical protein
MSRIGSVASDERLVEVDLDVDCADAENIELHYAGGDLRLRYVDWRERSREAVFADVLAFRWEVNHEAGLPRDDTTYEAIGSGWLLAYAEARVEESDYAHYKLAFNACGVLNLLCRRVGAAKQ